MIVTAQDRALTTSLQVNELMSRALLQVNFPDFERVGWLNSVVGKCCSTLATSCQSQAATGQHDMLGADMQLLLTCKIGCRAAVAAHQHCSQHHGAAAAGPADEGQQAKLDQLCAA